MPFTETQNASPNWNPDIGKLPSYSLIVVYTPHLLKEVFLVAGRPAGEVLFESRYADSKLLNDPQTQWRLWDLRSGTPKLLRFVSVDATTHAFFNSQETHLVAISTPSKERVIVAVWNLSTQNVDVTWEVPAELVSSFDWNIRLIPGAASPDGLAIQLGSQLLVFDIFSGATLHVIGAARLPVGSSISDGVFLDGKHLVMGDITLRVVNIETGNTISNLNCQVRSPSSIGQCLVTDLGKTIVVIDRDDSKLFGPRHQESVSDVDRGVRFFDTLTGVEKYSFADKNAQQFAFSPDGTVMATGVANPDKGRQVLLRFTGPSPGNSP